MRLQPAGFLARLSFVVIFLSPSIHIGDLRAGQNPAAQAAESARRIAREAEARRRTQRMMQHQFRDVKEVTFPKTFTPVWYRPEKLRSSVGGFLLSKEYESSGDLVIEKDALAFKTDKETMRIGYDQIEGLDYQILSTERKASAYPLDWAIVRYRSADGSTRGALFHDGTKSGRGEDTDLIFGSIRWALNAVRRETEAKLPPLERIRRWVERYEAMEAGQATGFTPEEVNKEIEQSATEMKAHLGAHPDDADALILSVRLDRFGELARPVVTTGANAEAELAQSARETRARIDSLASRLDRALAVQPNRAEAYYWKARIYGMRQPASRDGKFVKIPVDLQEAIRDSRRAVELVPESVVYREALAQYLILDSKSEDAAEVMRSVANGQHLISLLLVDRKAVPIPEGAVFLPEWSEGFAEMQMERGHIHDYPMLRAQVYVLRVAMPEVTSFYQKHWPGFQFFELEKEKDKEMEMHMYAQLLRGPSSALEPVKSKREINNEELSPDGPSLILFEFRRKGASGPNDYMGVPVGDVYCVLSIVNGRTATAR